ncbi:Ubiquitinyl hydrolase 1, variant 3 [Balamuthia mandrillaris]
MQKARQEQEGAESAQLEEQPQPEGSLRPPVSFHVDLKKKIFKFRAVLHHVPHQCLKFEPTGTHCRLDTLRFARKPFFIHFRYPHGISVDPEKAEAEWNAGVLSAQLPIIHLPEDYVAQEKARREANKAKIRDKMLQKLVQQQTSTAAPPDETNQKAESSNGANNKKRKRENGTTKGPKKKDNSPKEQQPKPSDKDMPVKKNKKQQQNKRPRNNQGQDKVLDKYALTDESAKKKKTPLTTEAIFAIIDQVGQKEEERVAAALSKEQERTQYFQQKKKEKEEKKEQKKKKDASLSALRAEVICIWLLDARRVKQVAKYIVVFCNISTALVVPVININRKGKSPSTLM